MHKRLTEPGLQARVRRILQSMTLAQKIGQMTQAERTTCSPQDVYRYHLGSVLSAAGSCPGDNTLDDWLTMCDRYWQASSQQDPQHLGIPILYGVDAVHGHSNLKQATIFPHNIGLGATQDFTLIEQIAKATAAEVAASGVDWVFAPNLAVAQDYRWGRTYESFSQDPDQVSRFAEHMVKGLQQDLSAQGVLACVKHWIGDGGTQNGIDQGDTLVDWQTLHDTHIRPYYAAIDAGAMTIMVSFSSWNGEKCHAHQHLLSDVLKGDMQFDGFLLSDMQGIDYLADDFYLAVAQGVNAGIDMFMVPDNWQLFIEHLTSHVELGSVPIERIDDAVSRILAVKIACGLLDKPAPSVRAASQRAKFGCEAHRQLARQAVQQSAVLLKNQQKLLPLSTQQRIMVTGKNADCRGSQCGGFTVTWQGCSDNPELPAVTSAWQAIAARCPSAQLVSNQAVEQRQLDDIDVAIMVIGESPYAEGVGDIRGDNDSIIAAGLQINGQLQVHQTARKSIALAAMYPQDLHTLKTLNQAGIPVVVVLYSGRPLLVDEEIALSSAFVVAWLPGSQAQGLSDLLFGDAVFTGRLPFDWPQYRYPFESTRPRAQQTAYPIGYGFSRKKGRRFKAAI